MTWILVIATLPFWYCFSTLALSSSIDYSINNRQFRFPLRSLLAETLLQYKVFFYLPLDLLRIWESRDFDNTNKIVILLPGYTETQFIFKKIRRQLKQNNIPFKTLRYKPLLGDLESQSVLLYKEILNALESNPQASIHIIGHSMGGLIGRYFIEQHNYIKIDSLIMISTPHQGTYFGKIAVGKCAKQIVPDSDFIQKLNHKDIIPNSFNVFSPADSLVTPRKNMLYLDNNIELDNSPLHNSCVNHPKMKSLINEIIING